MFSEVMPFLERDREAVKKLADFLPDRIFDAHAHLFDTELLPNLAKGATRVVGKWERYQEEMSRILNFPKELRINNIPYPDASMKTLTEDTFRKSDAFLLDDLKKDPNMVGEILVHPGERGEDLEKRLVSPAIRGFKCYHVLADKPEGTWNCTIGEYLPESAWEIANKRKMVITLHMVRDEAIYDEENLKYIRHMAQKYPDAVLILAHCGRAFASWTGVEGVEKVADLDNVWFDFSAVCESPAMFQILRKVGVDRCVWGSDYPVCRARGKCISLADSFYWIYQDDLNNFSSKTKLNDYTIATENLFAVRQAFYLAELGGDAVEKFFFHNAVRLFSR